MQRAASLKNKAHLQNRFKMIVRHGLLPQDHVSALALASHALDMMLGQ